MILSNTEILGKVNSGALLIDPFDEQYLQPASYDMRIGKDAATISNTDPIIDLEKAGFLLIAPYAPAVIYAMEHLRLPLNMPDVSVGSQSIAPWHLRFGGTPGRSRVRWQTFSSNASPTHRTRNAIYTIHPHPGSHLWGYFSVFFNAFELPHRLTAGLRP